MKAQYLLLRILIKEIALMVERQDYIEDIILKIRDAATILELQEEHPTK